MQAVVLAALGISLVAAGIHLRQTRVGILGVVCVAYAGTVYALTRCRPARARRDGEE